MNTLQPAYRCTNNKEAEERAERILDADFLKFNINEIVNELDINNDLKQKLKNTLKKFPNIFGGGLRTLSDRFPPAKIKLKEGAKSFAASYYTLPRAYEQPTRKEVDQMVAIGFLKKLN